MPKKCVILLSQYAIFPLYLGYTEMPNKVDPLRQELRTLEKSAETTRIKGEEIEKIVTELERSINK